LEKGSEDRMSYMIPHLLGQVAARIRVQETEKWPHNDLQNQVPKEKLQTTPTLLSRADYNQF
jgi:hypothetical protein